MNKHTITWAVLIGGLLCCPVPLPAEDYECVPECVEYEMEICGDETCKSFYLTVFGGIDELLFFNRHSTVCLNPKFTGGLILGSHLGDHFRVEAEYAYRRSSIFNCDYGNYWNNYTEKLDINSCMGNLLYDIPVGKCSFYFGLGIGYAWTHTQTFSNYYGRQRDCAYDDFAWQFIYGIKAPIANRTELGLRFNIFDRCEKNSLHQSLSIDITQYF